MYIYIYTPGDYCREFTSAHDSSRTQPGTLLGTAMMMQQKQVDKTNKDALFKSCTPFREWIREIINTQIDNTKDIDNVMPMYNLVEYSNTNSKTFKFQAKITRKTSNDDNTKCH